MSDALCTLENDDLSLAVAALGAEMQFLRTASGADLLWDGDATYWTGRAPVLFPIVGRAVDDVVAVDGHAATMGQHGIARRRVFDLEAQSDGMCRHVLRADEEMRAVYPCDFALAITHALDGPSLTVTAEVANRGQAAMPFCLGFHPAFRWPLPGAEAAPHLVSLAGGGTPARQVLSPDGLLRQGRVASPFQAGRLEITDGLFAEGALIFPGGSDALRYGPEDGPSLSFTFDNLPDLALWRPLGAPFLCIEPWHGTASVAGDGPEIAARPNALTLAPGESKAFSYTVTVSL